MTRLIAFVLLCFPFIQLSAQQCDTSRVFSSPVENYFLNADGSVTELETGLTWARCTVGQHWNGETCEGDSLKLTWQQAMEHQESSNKEEFAGRQHWRVPTLPELATIVERGCIQPRINLTLFPNAPSLPFWTATLKKDSPSEAFALDFDQKGLQVMQKSTPLLLRLVSGRN